MSYILTKTASSIDVVCRARLRHFHKLNRHRMLDIGRIHRDNLDGIKSAILKKIQEKLIYTDGGVLMDGVGYFFIWKIPRKVPMKRNLGGGIEGRQTFYNRHTGGHVYTPILLTTVLRKNPLMFWSMEFSFVRYVYRKMSAELRRGRKYKMYLSHMKFVRQMARNAAKRAKLIGKIKLSRKNDIRRNYRRDKDGF